MLLRLTQEIEPREISGGGDNYAMTTMSDYLSKLHEREQAALEASARQTVSMLEHITGVDVPSGVVRMLSEGRLYVCDFELFADSHEGSYDNSLFTYAVRRSAMPVRRTQYRYTTQWSIANRTDWIFLLERCLPYDIALQQSKLAAEMAGEAW